MAKNRPIGITILSALGFSSAAITILAGIILMLFSSAAMSTILVAFGALGAIAGVLLISYGAVQALISYGLWNMKKWAWVIAMISCGISLLYAIYEVTIVTNIASTIILVYLYSVRKKFR